MRVFKQVDSFELSHSLLLFRSSLIQWECWKGLINWSCLIVYIVFKIQWFFDRHLHIEIPLLIQAQEEVITIERLEHIHPTPGMCTSTSHFSLELSSYERHHNTSIHGRILLPCKPCVLFSLIVLQGSILVGTVNIFYIATLL